MACPPYHSVLAEALRSRLVILAVFCIECRKSKMLCSPWVQVARLNVYDTGQYV
jgi:hypothetical protein